MVYPAAVRYINELAAAVKETKALGIENSGASDMLKIVTDALNDLGSALSELAVVQKVLKGGENNRSVYRVQGEGNIGNDKGTRCC